MAHRKNPRFAALAGLIGLVLLLAGCGSDTDPDTWEQAEETGKVQENFMVSCEDANAGAAGQGDVPAYCDCAYLEIRDFYADDFEGFKDVESELRSDPEAINNTAVVPVAITDALEACADEHL